MHGSPRNGQHSQQATCLRVPQKFPGRTLHSAVLTTSGTELSLCLRCQCYRWRDMDSPARRVGYSGVCIGLQDVALTRAFIQHWLRPQKRDWSNWWRSAPRSCDSQTSAGSFSRGRKIPGTSITIRSKRSDGSHLYVQVSSHRVRQPGQGKTVDSTVLTTSLTVP